MMPPPIAGLLAAAVLTLGAAPAHGQGLVSSDYGGGAIPNTLAQTDKPPTLMLALQTPKRGGVAGRMFFHARTRCQIGSEGAILSRRIRVGASGAVSGRGTARYRDDEGRLRRTTYRIAGTLTGATGTGTFEATTRVSRGGRFADLRCASGPISWQLRAAVPSETAAPPTPGAAYFGVLAQRGLTYPNPLLLRVTPDARRIAATLFGVVIPCRRSEPSVFENFTPPAPIDKAGRFRKTERFRIRYGDGVARYTVRMAGRFTSEGGVTGAIRVQIRFAAKRGRDDFCDSGPLLFGAVQ